MRKIILSFAVLALGSIGCAATFTANGGVGSSTIGSGGDYATLQAAADDFNGSTAVTGDYVFYIKSDITETTAVAFGKDTANHNVTIRPQAGVSPTITFANQDKNVSWDSLFTVGVPSVQVAADTLIATNNFFVDGSNTVGGTARNMTFKNVKLDYQSTTISAVIRVVGACSNVQIKNLIVDNETSASTKEVDGIAFTSRHTAVTGALVPIGDYIPTNCRVENCLITCPNNNASRSIYSLASNTLGTGRAQTAMTFTKNDMIAGSLCMDMAQSADMVITDNTFTAVGGGSARPEVVRHTAVAGTTGWTVTVAGNKWLYTRGSATGPGLNNLLGMGGGTTAAATGTYNVYNNTFGGFDNSGVSVNSNTHGPAGGLYHCVVVGNPGIAVNFEHNSINMPNFSDMKSTGVLERYGAIAVSVANFTGSLRMRNNIIRMEQNNGVLLYRETGTAGTITSDYNVFWVGSAGATLAAIGIAQNAAANYPTLSSWQAAGYDTHSLMMNPNASINPGDGKWVLGTADNDLHFDAAPNAAYRMPVLSTVSDDIDHNIRPALTVAGADEIGVYTAASDWSLFR